MAGHVLQVYVTDNQEVQQGALLLEIDPRDYAARLTQARAVLQATVAKQQVAQANVELTQVTSNAGIQQAAAGVELAKAAVQTTRAQVVTARSRLKQARAQVDTAAANAAQAHAQVSAAAAEVTRADADAKRALGQSFPTLLCAPRTPTYSSTARRQALASRPYGWRAPWSVGPRFGACCTPAVPETAPPPANIS